MEFTSNIPKLAAKPVFISFLQGLRSIAVGPRGRRDSRFGHSIASQATRGRDTASAIAQSQIGPGMQYEEKSECSVY